MDTALRDYLISEGYTDLRLVGTRGICGIHRMAYTVGLFEGLDWHGYEGRWCFESMGEAKAALGALNDIDEPTGEWIKYKGRRFEFPNPLRNN